MSARSAKYCFNQGLVNIKIKDIKIKELEGNTDFNEI